MKYITSALTVCVVLLLTSCEEEDLQTVSWNLACKHSQYNCEGVPRPNVVENDAINKAHGAMGIYYPGEDDVFIRRSLLSDSQRYIVILVHEMTHYLQWAVGGFTTRSWDAMCEAEREAFEVSDKVARKLRRHELVRGDNWHVTYPYCNG